MAACANELVVSPKKIDAADLHYSVALENEAVVGFSAVERLTATRWELEALFVEPARTDHGIGHNLLRHASQLAARFGATTLVIQSDPNAADFYRRAGAIDIGVKESASIPGRTLPVLELSLHPG